MFITIPITGSDYTGTTYSLRWSGDVLTITHSMGSSVFAGVLDSNGRVLNIPTTMEDGAVTIDYTGVEKSGEVNLFGESTAESTDDDFTYYSGSTDTVMMFLKSLNISGDRLASVPVVNIGRMQRIVDDAIDGYLNEYYFTPLVPFHQVQPDGTVRTLFPGKIRLLAIQWVAGLMLQTEFQNLEPNINEQAQRFVEESKKEMQQIVDFSVVIPGQRRKNPSPTMPPNLAPSRRNEFIL